MNQTQHRNSENTKRRGLGSDQQEKSKINRLLGSNPKKKSKRATKKLLSENEGKITKKYIIPRDNKTGKLPKNEKIPMLWCSFSEKSDSNLHRYGEQKY